MYKLLNEYNVIFIQITYYYIIKYLSLLFSMSKNSVSFIIMAAGQGTRMNSNIPKVLNNMCGTPMIIHILKNIIPISHERIYVIVGKNKSLVQDALTNHNMIDYCHFVEQNNPLGTGHAIQCCIDHLTQIESQNFVILNGDNPLIQKKTIQSFINMTHNYDSCIMTYHNENPHGFGRIVHLDGIFSKIIEEKECTEIEKKIKKVNGGIYCFTKDILLNYIPKINNDNNTGEYYLTDIFELIVHDNKTVGTYHLTDNSHELLGVNTQNDLLHVESIYKRLYLHQE